ncbi:helix-turn-helix transcriptional regulator [uncultured Flavobacterium sp.]|uniref:helix-turn-helix transcriptional regulator n=1 Tax=uncultured Flavobacterium sp. TaxID=165435 RepID=UPI0025D9895C|nr:response regulator transcription factor [uncultured Flavobacterium sp.]
MAMHGQNKNSRPSGYPLKVTHFIREEGYSSLLCEDGIPTAYVLLYLAKGALRIDAGATSFQLASHDLLIIRCPEMATYVCLSTTVSVWQLQFTKTFLQDTALPVNHRIHKELEDKHFKCLTVSVGDFKMLKNLFLMIQKHTSEPKGPDSYDVSRICFNVMLHIVNSNRPQVTETQDLFGRAADQITHFLSLIPFHIHKEHTVRFYANSLCITRGHLARILKENGNRNPKLILETALAEAAKQLLQDSSLTIYAIAEMLHFSSASSFTNFFRKQTGMTPSEYRSSLSRMNH